WLDQALLLRQRVPADLEAYVLAHSGWVAYLQGDFALAKRHLERSIELWRETGNVSGLARSLVSLGSTIATVGEHDAAITLSEESLSLFAELGDTWGRAWALNNLGYVAARRGANERAVLLLEEGLALRRAVGDTDEIAWSLRDLGLAVGQQGDYERATALLEESLRLSRELGIKPGISISLNLLGEVARLQGQLDRAASLYEESLALDRDLGARHHQAIAHSNLGYVRLRQGDRARAGTHFVHSLTWFHSVRNPVGTAVCFPGLAGVIAAQGAPERAARLLGAIETLREAAAPYLVTTDIADYERILREVQARLDEAAFAAAWAEGRAMTLEQAIADALTVASHARPCE
ncbi:MAG TPA: tetratricopeptide repeat protein, partial [Ardenticatenaceae bacterium]|nr:tetratricopeptide repeat protein [Ardenticatenaceae bacterium]